MPSLKEYQYESRESVASIAKRFCVSRAVIYQWMGRDAFISGKKGDQKITINRQVAAEQEE